ncbi:MAG TPA: hypothetical protein VGN23_14950, partial [Verrucomicrobiae bacterium]
ENWRYTAELRELQKRLAIVIQRLELTTSEIAVLPDNYVAAENTQLQDLPHGLFQTNSDWINLRDFTADLTTPAHDIGFRGHSVFMVFFHDPDGRKTGLDYLKRLNAVSPRFVDSDQPIAWQDLNPALPQFPTNSQWALVRRMCVIDIDGRIRPTHVTESIQMRTYLNIKEMYGTYTSLDGDQPPQHFDEFRMLRDTNAALNHIEPGQKDFISNNFPAGNEPFEWVPPDQMDKDQRIRTLQQCSGCHSGPGIYSINSFSRFLAGPPKYQISQLAEGDLDYEAMQITNWKYAQSNWKLLQSLLMQRK